MLRIALPAGKSLEERTTELFEEARITVERKNMAHTVTFPDYQPLSEGRFVKPRRIPQLVAEGVFDIGITGNDTVFESGESVQVYAELPYSRFTELKTRAVLFVAKDDPAETAADVPPGSNILSEYPNSTRGFFGALNKEVAITESPGAAEAEVPFTFRFGVALTETGSSLRRNNLREIATLFQSSTVLVVNKSALENDEKESAIRSLKHILQGVLEARCRVLLSANVPGEQLEKVLALLPALQSPTVSALAGGTFQSVSSVVLKSEVNMLIPKLLKEGAEGLLILPIAGVIPKW